MDENTRMKDLYETLKSHDQNFINTGERMTQMKNGLNELHQTLAAVNQNLEYLLRKANDTGAGSNSDRTEGSGNNIARPEVYTPPHIRNQNNQQNLSYQGYKLEFPEFNGVNPQGWICKANRYFLINQNENWNKVLHAGYYMIEAADTWYMEYIEGMAEVDWETFCEMLLQRFLSPGGEDVMIEFTRLNQSHDVTSYQEKFDELKSLVRVKNHVRYNCFGELDVSGSRSGQDNVVLKEVEVTKMSYRGVNVSNMDRLNPEVQEMTVTTTETTQSTITRTEEVTESSGNVRARQETYTPPHIRNQNNQQGLPSLTYKIDFSEFNGENPQNWIRKANKFFQLNQSENIKKVLHAGYYMIDEADTWYMEYVEGQPGIDWETFCEMLLQRFIAPGGEDISAGVSNEEKIEVLNVSGVYGAEPAEGTQINSEVIEEEKSDDSKKTLGCKQVDLSSRLDGSLIKLSQLAETLQILDKEEFDFLFTSRQLFAAEFRDADKIIDSSSVSCDAFKRFFLLQGVLINAASNVVQAVKHDVMDWTSSKGWLNLPAGFSMGHYSNKFVMAEFYAPWCGHCQALAPEYANAVDERKDKNVVLAKVEATEEAEFGNKFDVHRFPTIFIVVDGVHNTYPGQRTKEAIVNWLKEKIGPGLGNLTATEDVERVLLAEDKLVLGHLDSLVGSEREELAATSNLEDDVSCYQTTSPDVAKLFHIDPSIKRPTMVILEKEVENMNHFGVENPIKRQLILFSTYKDSEKTYPVFLEAAKAFKRKLVFVYMELDNEEVGKPVSEYFGVTWDAPMVFAYTGNDDARKIALNGELTISNVDKCVLKLLWKQEGERYWYKSNNMHPEFILLSSYIWDPGGEILIQ